MITLRDYQEECLDKLTESFSKHQKVLISIPTGGGKTVIFNTFALRNGYRMLVIAHRDELLEQAVEKYVMVGGEEEETGFIRNGEWEERFYTAASVQTLYRNLDKVDGRKWDLVVCDEAQHILAPTYQAVFSRLLSTNPKLKVLGVTATPFRSDKKDLKSFFETLAYSIDILELIKRGYLVPVRGKLVELPVDMSKLKTVRTETGERDYSLSSISKAFNKEEINKLIVDRWLEEAENRKTIFYTSSLDHALALWGEFERRGIPAAYVDGRMSLEKRRAVLKAFKEGRIKVLTNMNVLTEGFDDPEVECVALVRPTKSLVLYAQIVGRGLRIAPNKEDCLILDYTGVSRKHTVVGLCELFGLDDEIRKELKKGKQVSVGAVEENGERKVAVLVGDEVREFVFEGKEAGKYATKVGDSLLLSCGMNGKTLVMEREGNFYSIYLLASGKRKKLKEKLAEDYAYTVLTTLWKRERDDFLVNFVERAKELPPTEKQRRIVENARLLRLITQEEFEEIVKSRIKSSNLISYLFSRGEFRVCADLVLKVNQTDDGKVYVFDSLQLSARDVLCLAGAGCYVVVETATEMFDVSLKTLPLPLKEKALKLAEERENLEKLLKLPLPGNAKEKVEAKLEELEENEEEILLDFWG